ncbi:MAG: hypothetical protein JEZ05_06255 [Tenericutes bacterium]|nr:hypothetical protein [Mycoplasmatota bacterium]
MGNAKLKLFRINSKLMNLEKVLEKFVLLTCVYPVKANEFVKKVHGLASIDTSNPYLTVFEEFKEIEKENNLQMTEDLIGSKVYDYEEIKKYISELHKKLKDLNAYKRETEDIIRKYSNALIQVKNIEDLDISLDDLFSCEYINSRFGRMPIDSLEKLAYHNKHGFIFQIFREEKKYCWCMYLSTDRNEREIDNIFSGLFFERINIPDFVHGTPEIAQATLADEIHVAKENLKEITESLNREIEENIEKLAVVKSELVLLEKISDAKKFIVILGENFIINGFVRTKNVSLVENQFVGMDDVEITFLPSDSDKRLTAPKKIK